jgi:16S rRNA (uracil1498-N3)-methyltransferase
MFFGARGELVAGGVVELAGGEARHAAVRRLRPGERVEVTDGAGLIATCTVVSGTRFLVESVTEVAPPALSLTVVQAIPKGDRGELAVEEMTEVGVDRIVPWAAARCVPVWRGPQPRGLDRWRAAAREAAKQSRRAWLPEVTSPQSTAQVAALVGEATASVILEPEAADALSGLQVPAEGSLVLIVGPEGGNTEAELDAFTRAGASPRRLGPTVLRTSTAGAVAAAILLSRSDRWA